MGWMPFYPQFNRNPFDVVREAGKAGARSDSEIVQWVVKQLQRGQLRLAVKDSGAPENWPRVWFIWRGNPIASSAKGHEFFLRHYLGTYENAIAEE